MDDSTLAPSGALDHARLPVLSSGEDVDADLAIAKNPAEVLAALMDFPGSVALAELLESAPSTVQRPENVSELGERLMEDVAARLSALEPLALKPLLGRRAHSVPCVEELSAVIERFGLASTRDEGAIQKLADELGEPYRQALSTCLRQAQAHISTLRWEVAHDIRGLGPTADKLERLDAAVTRSMQAKLGDLFDRMEQAAHATFLRAATHAVMELPENPDLHALSLWVDDDGWIARYRERCVRMARALFGHMRRNLEGLVRAAVRAEGV
jgi:hypothetical protein